MASKEYEAGYAVGTREGLIEYRAVRDAFLKTQALPGQEELDFHEYVVEYAEHMLAEAPNASDIDWSVGYVEGFCKAVSERAPKP